MCDFGISRQPRGAALVIVMLVMAVLLMAGTTFLTISSTESQIALNEHGSARALVLAEAAIHKAIASLNDSVRGPAYLANNGEMNTMLGGGTFTLSFVVPSSLPASRRCPTDNSKDLIATASVPIRGGQAQAQLQVTVDKVSYPYRWAAFAATPNQLIYSLYDPLSGYSRDRTNSELWLNHGDLVDSFDSGAGPYDLTTNSGQHGNVGANGDVDIDYNSTIKGNVQAGDDIIKSSGVTVTGTEASNLSPEPTDPGVPFPTVTPGVTPTGGLTVPAGGKVTLSAGTHYYTNIKMEDNAKLETSGGPVTIVVTGPPVASTNKLADLGDNVTLGAHPGTQLTIITKSDTSETDFLTFVAQSGFRLYGSIYGTHTDIYLGANSQIFGSIIGRTMRASTGTKMHYDQAMSNRELCHNGKFTIRRGTWREIIPST